ncbi:MAG TPA: hypothetical protein VER83_05100, partial [Candidatus Nanopelagicales bacterium]|nr:hypothetical protein [Candidatus Nanopelagicales bacterium]
AATPAPERMPGLYVGHGAPNFRNQAPGMPYAHPTAEHLAPLFVTLGAAAAADEAPDVRIEGYWYGLAKRSFAVR